MNRMSHMNRMDDLSHGSRPPPVPGPAAHLLATAVSEGLEGEALPQIRPLLPHFRPTDNAPWGHTFDADARPGLAAPSRSFRPPRGAETGSRWHRHGRRPGGGFPVRGRDH